MMKTTVSRLYDTQEAAANAVSGLIDAGIPHDDISLIAHNPGGRSVVETAEAGDGASTGAGIGGVLGGGAGLLAGLGLLAIPGLGPVVAAGWLASTAAGAVAGVAAGAVTGGIVGALAKAGIEEEHAHVYAEGVRRGGALVTARVDERDLPAANAALDRHTPIDLDVRARAYRETGWKRFDERADPYTLEEAARDRLLYQQGPMI